MVGATTALALAQHNLRIAWVSGPSIQAYSPDDDPDLRMSALSLGSVRLLEQLGAWPYIQKMRCKAYTSLVAFEGKHGKTEFTAKEVDDDKLGYFVENRLVQLACEQALEAHASVAQFKDCAFVGYRDTANLNIQLADKQTINANWLIAADGARSSIRQQAGIGTSGWQYSQQAMGIVVELAQPSGDETWQEFNPSGPRALLPMHDNFASLIWYDQSSELQRLMGLSDEQLITAIYTAFPERLPPIKRIVNKANFPLTRMHAHQYRQDKVLLVGDAAHTVNPLAGQGVNMGLGDVKCLTEVLAQYQSDSPYDDKLINALDSQFSKQRRRENATMMLALDAIYTAFKQDSSALGLLRQLGLKIADRSGPIKQLALKRALGIVDF